MSTDQAVAQRWLALLIPFEERRFPAATRREAEARLEQVRVHVEQLIDGHQWLRSNDLRLLYVAVHPRRHELKENTQRNRRNEDVEWIDVDLAWTHFAGLAPEHQHWALLDLILDALRSSKTTKRLGEPPLRRQSIELAPVVPKSELMPDAAVRNDCPGCSVLEGVSDGELVVLRPFPADVAGDVSLDIIERYDRDFANLFQGSGRSELLDSEINSGFLRWVINATPDRAQ